MSAIDELESRLQKLLEARILLAIPLSKPEDQIAQRLASAMASHIIKEPDGTALAPNLYVIIAHPAALAELNLGSEHLETLSNALKEIGEEAGFKFTVRPRLTTTADATMKRGEFRILANFRDESLHETKNMSATPASVQESDLPANAFLILQGTNILPLTQPVVNIGRRLDNQVVVDDPRVSRNHAQMRVIKSRYVIFDLESTGGLYVNGQRISQSVLYPGDVISLAGVTLIFGQDMPSGRTVTPEQPGSALSSDRPTVIFKNKKNIQE